MEYIIKYLSNPLKIGVHNSRFSVDISQLGKLFREMAGAAEKLQVEPDYYIKSAEEFEKGRRFRLRTDYALSKLNEALLSLAAFNDCPKEVHEYLGIEFPDSRHIPSHYKFQYRKDYLQVMLRGKEGMLDSRIFKHIPDVAVIETTPGRTTNVFVLDVTTIKKNGTSMFEKFVTCIPHIGKTLNSITQRKTFSSRYTFRPYPLAVQLWLNDEKALIVPKDLKDFLTGAVRYHSSEEWRTSIVLSAITTESILADLYEEKYKEYAPNVPLGDLYQKVKGKIDFPSEIARAIEIVNESRIAAVHRSGFPVSDREATNALYGATTFTMWYSSNY